MEEKEFFNDLKNLVWNKFPYCRINKIKIYSTLIYLNKEFEDTIIIDVEFIYLNIGRHLRYQIKTNEVKKTGKKIEKELSAKILEDIKNFQIDNVD